MYGLVIEIETHNLTTCTSIHDRETHKTETYNDGVVSLRQNIQQICRRDEVESGEGKSFGLEILSESFLTQTQVFLQTLEPFEQTRLVCSLHHIFSHLYFGDQALQYIKKSLQFFYK